MAQQFNQKSKISTHHPPVARIQALSSGLPFFFVEIHLFSRPLINFSFFFTFRQPRKKHEPLLSKHSKLKPAGLPIEEPKTPVKKPEMSEDENGTCTTTNYIFFCVFEGNKNRVGIR